MSLSPMVGLELRLQLRYGFYAAYAFVAVTYIALLRMLPAEAQAVALPPMLLAETSVIGFVFAGTLLHLERTEGVLEALAVTPLRTRTYLLSRVAALSFFAGLVTLVVMWGAAPAGPGASLLAAATGALAAAMFVPIGLAAAARFDSLEGFIVWGGLGTAVFTLPLLPYFGVLESPLWWLTPTHPVLVLLARSVGRTHGQAPTSIVMAVLAGWAVLAFFAVRPSLHRRVSRKGGA